MKSDDSMKWQLMLLMLLLFTTAVITLPYLTEATTGTYVYNQTGTIVEVGEIKDLNVSQVSMSFFFLNNGTFLVFGGTLNVSSSIPVNITVSYPNGTSVGFIAFDVLPGTNFTQSLFVPDNNVTYVVVNAKVNGIDTGLFAVPREEGELNELSMVKSYVTDSSYKMLLTILVNLVAFSPLLGMYLRGKMRESGIGAIILGLFFVPTWMSMMGISPQLIAFATTMAVVSGLLMVIKAPE